MGGVKITIKDEAYEYLKSLKGTDKSFSDVILDFKKTRKPMIIREAALTYGGGVSSNEVTAWKVRIKKAREWMRSGDVIALDSCIISQLV